MQSTAELFFGVCINSQDKNKRQRCIYNTFNAIYHHRVITRFSLGCNVLLCFNLAQFHFQINILQMFNRVCGTNFRMEIIFIRLEANVPRND